MAVSSSSGAHHPTAIIYYYRLKSFEKKIRSLCRPFWECCDGNFFSSFSLFVPCAACGTHYTVISIRDLEMQGGN